MKPFFSLVDIFMRQLIRSKALWVITGILALMLLYNLYYQSMFSDWLDDGITYDMATRKAFDSLRSLAGQIRTYAVFFTVVIAAVVAPESRKNGTTQFVLSMQVSRRRLALAQFTALGLFLLAAVLIVHLGFSIFAMHVGFMTLIDLVFSWILLFLPLLLAAAVSFSLSLTFSTVVVYLIVFGIPFVLLDLLEALIAWQGSWIPVPVARVVDNLAYLMPDTESIIFWPFLSPRLSVADPPFPVWTWSLLNFCFSVCFWVLLGLMLYRNYNIGSRQALK